MYDRLISVSQLNQYVGELLSADPMLHGLRVQGEISGFKRHSSGHLYFSLKDDAALVRCVMFRSQASQLDFRPEDGMQVILTGYASLYARDGSFQLYALSLDKQGEGALYQRFLQLKERLEREGYFDPAHKSAIPFLPRRVGVVTSGTGAAVQDVLTIIDRRFPDMPIVLAPVRVQGGGAAEEIAAAIAEMNRKGAADVLIVGRGGGSIEDLWAFNEPIVARAIYESRIPVISAVGHETDFTIADFTADLRAPTPSAAAELAVPIEDECRMRVLECERRLQSGLAGTVLIQRGRVKLIAASHAFRVPMERIMELRLAVETMRERMTACVRESLRDSRVRVQSANMRVEGMSPLGVLERGYALIRDAQGAAVTGVASMQVGQTVRIALRDGTADAAVERIEHGKHGEDA